MVKSEATAIRENTQYTHVVIEKCDQQTQATERLDAHIFTQHEEQREEMEEEMDKVQAELLDAEEMIGHLQEDLKEIRRQRDDNLQMFLKSQEQLGKLESKVLYLRHTPNGQALHFDSRCPHWQSAKMVELCKRCQDEVAVFD